MGFDCAVRGDEMNWVVWSEEHGAWWRFGNYGYTRSLFHAGRYSETEAKAIADRANRYLSGGQINEVAMPDPIPR
jgi:hypothetical protein